MAARRKKLRIMISSRCNDSFDGRKMSGVRRSLKSHLEALTIFGAPILEVWINEDEPPQPGSADSWDTCLETVRDCDVLLALSNGNAGWARQDSDIGICHAELMEGLRSVPAKVRLVELEPATVESLGDAPRNQRFREYLDSQKLFSGRRATNQKDLTAQVEKAVREVLITLAQAGVRDAGRERFDSGQALDWTRMSFSQRAAQMRMILRETIAQRSGSNERGDHVTFRLHGRHILCVAHAIPAALGVAAAAEMVGRPFLADYLLAPVLDDPKLKPIGPLHIIACHRNATETQATRLLGFPDATVVSTQFGIFVADEIRKVQFAFITHCRDSTTTRHNVQRFFEWLDRSGEGHQVVRRAASRARIVKAIATENLTGSKNFQ